MFFATATLETATIASATSLEELTALVEDYVLKLRRARRLPDACSGLSAREPAELFDWWVRLDRLSSDCVDRRAEALMRDCHEVFGAAWQRAAELGYRMERRR